MGDNIMIILNQEQEKIAFAKGAGVIGVKGIAGSGKTSCGIARVPFLLQNYCQDGSDRVLLMTYNKTLVNYVSSIYTEYKSNKFTLFPLEDSKVEICSIDKLMHGYYRGYCSRKRKEILDTISEYEANEILKTLIASYHKNYPSIKQVNETNFDFIKKELSWIQNCNYLNESEYQAADRSGLNSQDLEGPQKLAKNSEVRQVIFKILTDFLNEIKGKKKITFEAFRICALKEVRQKIKFKYKHIIVDEAQDLSKTQLEFIREIYKDDEASSIMFLYDGAQSIYDQAWIGKKRSFKSVGFDLSGKVRTLTKNFRTTTQISKAAYSIFKNNEAILNDDHYIQPKLIDKQGEFPTFKKFDTFHEQAQYIRDIISRDLSHIRKKDIVVIARTTDILKELFISFNSLGVPAYLVDKNIVDFSLDEIKLVTMHSIKGLESKVVIIASCNDGVLPIYLTNEPEAMQEQEIMEKKLFYVGMTRATEKLYLLSHGKESKFINDIDKNYLQFDKNMRMRALYNVSIDDYLFSNHLRMDIYKSEEKIRQWLLKELIEIYQYSIDNIEIEYQLKMGSSTRFADIVVYREGINGKSPHILIEIKKEGSLVESDKKQLESYWSVSPTVQFAILTDGKTVNIYDKDFNLIDDLPVFSATDAAIAKKLNYLAFKEGYDCQLFTYEYEKKIDIYENNEVRSLINEDLNLVPIIGKISAGYGSEMIENFMGEIALPKKWSTSSILLKVSGDSMIDADINDGDLALIKKGIQPLNGDIIACAISNEDCTLKRFQKKADQIILIPENKDYERIYLNVDDDSIRIIGVLAGLIKN